jgi:mono/diheme cytochrome c family protein
MVQMKATALIEIKVNCVKREDVMRRLILSLLLLATPFGAGAHAADALKGQALAKRWCATCHIVASDQQRGTAQAPPFSAVANKAGFDERMVAYFLLTPHPRMPDMNLTRNEAADLAAYINTQR